MTFSILNRKAFITMVAVVAAAAALPASADEQPGSHDSHHPNGQATAAATPAAAAAAPADTSSTMMSNMKALQDQMAKIRTATDPKARAKLLDEHLKTMQDTMKLMMSSNGGCPMMNAGASAQGGMMGNGDMMQMMMDQMVQHQSMMQPPAK